MLQTASLCVSLVCCASEDELCPGQVPQGHPAPAQCGGLRRLCAHVCRARSARCAAGLQRGRHAAAAPQAGRRHHGEQGGLSAAPLSTSAVDWQGSLITARRAAALQRGRHAAAAPQAGRGDCSEQGGLSAAPQPLSTSAVTGNVPPPTRSGAQHGGLTIAIAAVYQRCGQPGGLSPVHAAGRMALLREAWFLLLRCTLSCLHSGFTGWLEHSLLQGAGACLWSFGRVLNSM